MGKVVIVADDGNLGLSTDFRGLTQSQAAQIMLALERAKQKLLVAVENISD
jgi:hypothetical protein